jgi:hypothetical protein
MSVIDVTQMWSKRGGQFSSENFSIYSARYQFTEAFMVVAEIGDDQTVVVGAAGIPTLGEQHPSGAWSFAKNFNPQQIGPITWIVTVGYEGPPNPNFENDVVDVEWTDTTSTEPIDRDYNGRAIVTENNEKVEGLTMELADQVCVIRRRFSAINTKAIAAYRHATNSDTFLDWPPGTARLIGFSAKNQFAYGSPNEGWDVTARFQFREGLAGATDAQAWYKRWRHEGFLVKVGSVIRRATDSQSVEVSKPVLLKTDGTEETNPDNAVFKYTQIYGSLPFSALGLI